MATSLQTLIDRTRLRLRDLPDYDQLTTSLAASGTTINVADVSLYRNRWAIEVDYETIMLRNVPSSGTSMTGTRAWAGSTAATHANNAGVLIRPNWYVQDIVNALNEALQSMFPYVYKPVVDTSLTVNTNQYQYVIPNMPGTSYPMPYIYKLEILQPGDYTFRSTRRWEVGRGTVTAGSPSLSGSISSSYPIVKFKSLPPVGATIRIQGFGPMPGLSALTDTLDAQFPPQCEYILTKLAAGYLLMGGEAGRDRSDTGPVDRREEANRPGASLQAGLSFLSRGDQELLRTAMPPLPRHIKAVI